MENKINIAELLKDCPKGMELYSPIFGEVYLDKIRPHLAIVVTTDKEQGDFKEEFFYDGRYGMNGECMLFPSKGKTTWEGFHRPFKDGDILAYTSSHTTVFIYRNKDNEPKFTTSFYFGYTIGVCYCDFHIYNQSTLIALNGDCDVRLATEEEKQKLFDAIKANGYKWNAETKTLEKLPKFKEIHFYKDYKDLQDVTVIAVCHNYAINAIKNDEPIIHTTAITALDMTGLLDRGYKIYLHENGRVGELRLGATSLTDKELRIGHNAARIWIGGGFEDFFYR